MPEVDPASTDDQTKKESDSKKKNAINVVADENDSDEEQKPKLDYLD